MGATFTVADKYSREKAYTRIIFGDDAFLMETELNEMQKILIERISSLVKSVATDGFVNKPPITFVGGVVTLPVDTFISGGIIYDILEPMTIAASSGDTIYLAIWEAEVNFQTQIRKGGNQSNGSVIANGIFDERAGEETSRRVQLQLQLVKSNTDPNKTYLPVASVSTGGIQDLRGEVRMKMEPTEMDTGAIIQTDSAQFVSKTQVTKWDTASSNATSALREASAAYDRAAEAESSAKNYADSSFVKPSEMSSNNVLQNSSGALGLNYWVNSGSYAWTVASQNNMYADISRTFFNVMDALPAGYAILQSDSMRVSAGVMYFLQAMFCNTSAGTMKIEVFNAANGVLIAEMLARPTTPWHRVTKAFAIPAGVTNVYLRLVATGGTTGVKGITNVKLSKGSKDVPYSNEGDADALFQYGVNRKSEIAGVINAKGVPASAADTWDALKNKISQIRNTFTTVNLESSQSIDYERYSDYTYNQYLYYFTIYTIPAGTKLFNFNGRAVGSTGTGSSWGRPIPSDSYISASSTSSYSQSGSSAYIVLVDANGYEWSLTSVHAPSNTTGWDNTQINMLEVDSVTRKLFMDTFGTRSDSTNYWLTSNHVDVPASFDLKREIAIKIKFQVLKPSSGWSYTRLAYKMKGTIKYI